MTPEPESGRPSYRPKLSAEDAARIREWHERAYEDLRRREPGEVSYLGRTFFIGSQVFPPTPMSDLLGRAVLAEAASEDRVLDMGTGCGVNAVLAASRGAHVVGVDVNPHAVECARRNATTNGVADKTEFFVSDVFERVEGDFDLIVFDPPFRWYPPRDRIEAAIADEGYRALGRFFEGARERLRSGGRILLFFGTSGDLEHVLRLVDRHGFRRETLAERALEKDGWTVRYYVYRLT